MIGGQVTIAVIIEFTEYWLYTLSPGFHIRRRRLPQNSQLVFYAARDLCVADSLFQGDFRDDRSEEHTSELQSRLQLVCRLLLEKTNHAGTNYRRTSDLAPTIG